MKIQEMTHEEIIVLDDNAIRTIMDYALAENGVRILEHPKNPEKPVLKEKDEAFRLLGLVTKDKDILNDIRSLIEENQHNFLGTEGISGLGYNYKFFLPLSSYYQKNNTEIDTVSCYLKEDLEEHKEALQRYEADKKEYDRLKNIYDENAKKEKEVTEYPLLKINAHKALERNVRQLLKEFNERYMTLSNSDFNIAINFFSKAFSNEQGYDYIEYIIRKEHNELEQGEYIETDINNIINNIVEDIIEHD